MTATTEQRNDRLRLAFAGLHPQRSLALRDRLGVAGAVRHLERNSKVPPPLRDAVAVSAVERRRELAVRGCDVVFKGDAGYPPHLDVLPDAPDVLFVRGEVPSIPLVAVVGTRSCTAYGRSVAYDYGVAIGEAGWGVISGLARGIDAAAHRGNLAAGTPGVAVLGCGLDVVYPKEHAPLVDGLIEAGGAVVSEYPPGTRPDGWRFPPRNRIISGAARAVVIVEAGMRGGALITARYAMEQGRPVFVLPGDITRPTSEGCNRLIRDGAHPVLDAGDLVEELELVLGPVEQPVVRESVEGNERDREVVDGERCGEDHSDGECRADRRHRDVDGGLPP